ncbi:MAG: LysR family transcriptional regulator [Myxococcales bacterium]|nr:LysR family transcriptional regulator [Myxococcales bacterium]
MARQSTRPGTRRPDFGTLAAGALAGGHGALDDLAVFLAIAAAGSFTLAARRSAIPKSTVSRAVARLEQRLGVALLRRTTRRVALTDDGRQLALAAAPHLEGLREALAVAHDDDGELQGVVRVTAPAFTGATIVAQRLGAFARAHPRVRIELDTSNVIRDLVAEGWDLGVRVGPLADADFVSRRLWTGRFGVFCARRGGGERKRRVTRADLEGGPCVVMRTSSRWRFRDARGLVADVVPGAAFVVNDPRAAMEAAAAGAGWVLAPLDAARARGDLAEARCELGRPEPIDLHAVFPTRRLLPRRVRAALEWLAKEP